MLARGNHAHYEIGIEQVLRKSFINYISTNESRKAFTKNKRKLKNFDVLINSKQCFIVDFKGKQFSYPGAIYNKYENWLPENHVTDLILWESEFKFKVVSLLVFLFKLSSSIDKKKFVDNFTYKGISYGVVAITPQNYLKNSKPRSRGVINVSRSRFQEIVKPLSSFIPEIKYK